MHRVIRPIAAGLAGLALAAALAGCGDRTPASSRSATPAPARRVQQATPAPTAPRIGAGLLETSEDRMRRELCRATARDVYAAATCP
jgi:hypothetical protein